MHGSRAGSKPVGKLGPSGAKGGLSLSERMKAAGGGMLESMGSSMAADAAGVAGMDPLVISSVSMGLGLPQGALGDRSDGVMGVGIGGGGVMDGTGEGEGDKAGASQVRGGVDE